MATIVLSAVGTLVGGPIGGAIGAFAGQQIDAAIFGGGSQEGPRIDDLKITTSSYGAPLPKHFGRMRTAGTIIWATDLREDNETSGGKGKPKTTSFSYSISMAIALSSRPIMRLGRIWADGNLLRGASEYLKVGGTLRLYTGHGDQPVDPLLAAAQGADCPAFRGCSYVVFEDLQLEDFGNRVPALSFEVFADESQFSLNDIVQPPAEHASGSTPLDHMSGFSYTGGTLASAVNLIGELHPIIAESNSGHVRLSSETALDAEPIPLPATVATGEAGEFGQADGQSRQRQAGTPPLSSAIRYYDLSRDYQSGVQRPDGRASLAGNRIIEFPGALTPNDARLLINRAASHDQRGNERLKWRIAELDPALTPGQLVTAPDIAGNWIISGWEWRANGVELELERPSKAIDFSSEGDVGNPAIPPDTLPYPTRLRAFELPWDGWGSPYEPRIFAAASAEAHTWSGAALYSGSGGPLNAIGATGRQQATMGTLTSPLKSSSALLFESDAIIEIETVSDSMAFTTLDLNRLIDGGNRLLVGEEIVQFGSATPLGPRQWRLQGLLRGRGGSEATALQGHDIGTQVTLIDDKLTPIDSQQLPPSEEKLIAAIGRGDEEPVIAEISNRGTTLRPLSPVHPRVVWGPGTGLHACWARRARGAWRWIDGVETPLVEAAESYRVGIGSTHNPDLQWQVDVPEITLDPEQVAAHSAALLWVKQVGSTSLSDPLLLTILP